MSAVFSFAGNNAYVSACFNLGMLACFGCYFLQLFFGCSLTGSCKVFISNSFIAKTAYGCSSAIHNNIASYYAACCYTAACPDSAFAAANIHKSVSIISGKENILVQSNFVFLATVFIEAFGYNNVITFSNSGVLLSNLFNISYTIIKVLDICFVLCDICPVSCDSIFIGYDICSVSCNICFVLCDICFVLCNILIGLMQLAAIDSVGRGAAYFTCCYAMNLHIFLFSIRLAQINTIVVNYHLRGTVTDACSIHSQGYTGISVNYTGNIVQFTGKVNFYIVAIVANHNILMIAGILFTAEINGCFRCYLIFCAAFSRKLPAFIGICSCFFQLAYVYSVGIFNTCFNIDNLTFSTNAAYRYSISSVSYAACTQSNTAFTGNLCIMTENNSVINSCFG